jgi:hypothetical protein
LSYQAPITLASKILNSEFKKTYDIDLDNFEGIYTSKLTRDKIIIAEGKKLYLKTGSN